MPIKHTFTSAIADGDDTTLIQPSDWNAVHSGTESYPMNFRLSLESTTPLSITDQTAKTTLYMVPYFGNQIALYNESTSKWEVLTSGSISLSLSGYTANKNYDIWCFSSAGVATLGSTVWTNDTTRATPLITQDGVLVKTGSLARRYIGTIRTTGTTGQCADSAQYRYVSNFYNREKKHCRIATITKTGDVYLYFVIGDPNGSSVQIGASGYFTAGGAIATNQTAEIYVYSSLIPSTSPGHFKVGVLLSSDQDILQYRWLSRSDFVLFPTGYGYLKFTPYVYRNVSDISGKGYAYMYM